jgi:hypothetical protein
VGFSSALWNVSWCGRGPEGLQLMRISLGDPDNHWERSRLMPVRYLSMLIFLPLMAGLVPAPSPAARVAVLSIALNNVANQPTNPDLPARLRLLATALRERLGSNCGYQVIPVDSEAEAAAELGAGYLYAHPDVAVRLVAPMQAQWVVIPRLNRATPWVTDLQAQVVRVRDTVLVSNRIVELKGIELTPELAARLAERGGAWMADQISQAIEHTSSGQGSISRRCPA